MQSYHKGEQACCCVMIFRSVVLILTFFELYAGPILNDVAIKQERIGTPAALEAGMRQCDAKLFGELVAEIAGSAALSAVMVPVGIGVSKVWDAAKMGLSRLTNSIDDALTGLSGFLEDAVNLVKTRAAAQRIILSDAIENLPPLIDDSSRVSISTLSDMHKDFISRMGYQKTLYDQLKSKLNPVLERLKKDFDGLQSALKQKNMSDLLETTLKTRKPTSRPSLPEGWITHGSGSTVAKGFGNRAELVQNFANELKQYIDDAIKDATVNSSASARDNARQALQILMMPSDDTVLNQLKDDAFETAFKQIQASYLDQVHGSEANKLFEQMIQAAERSKSEISDLTIAELTGRAKSDATKKAIATVDEVKLKLRELLREMDDAIAAQKKVEAAMAVAEKQAAMRAQFDNFKNKLFADLGIDNLSPEELGYLKKNIADYVDWLEKLQAEQVDISRGKLLQNMLDEKINVVIAKNVPGSPPVLDHFKTELDKGINSAIEAIVASADILTKDEIKQALDKIIANIDNIFTADIKAIVPGSETLLQQLKNSVEVARTAGFTQGSVGKIRDAIDPLIKKLPDVRSIQGVQTIIDKLRGVLAHADEVSGHVQNLKNWFGALGGVGTLGSGGYLTARSINKYLDDESLKAHLDDDSLRQFLISKGDVGPSIAELKDFLRTTLRIPTEKMDAAFTAVLRYLEDIRAGSLFSTWQEERGIIEAGAGVASEDDKRSKPSDLHACRFVLMDAMGLTVDADTRNAGAFLFFDNQTTNNLIMTVDRIGKPYQQRLRAGIGNHLFGISIGIIIKSITFTSESNPELKVTCYRGTVPVVSDVISGTIFVEWDQDQQFARLRIYKLRGVHAENDKSADYAVGNWVHKSKLNMQALPNTYRDSKKPKLLKSALTKR